MHSDKRPHCLTDYMDRRIVEPNRAQHARQVLDADPDPKPPRLQRRIAIAALVPGDDTDPVRGHARDLLEEGQVATPRAVANDDGDALSQ
jgi:hypothetical protein